MQNYPNPFIGSTTIEVKLGTPSNINFTVSNIYGETVAQQNYSNVNGQLKINFDASNLASGIYFYTVQTDSNSITKKMIVQK